MCDCVLAHMRMYRRACVCMCVIVCLVITELQDYILTTANNSNGWEGSSWRYSLAVCVCCDDYIAVA